MAFCPACGKDAVDVFCEEHLKEQKPLVTNIKPFTLIKCPTCDRIKLRGNWTKLDEFPHIFKKHFAFHQNAHIVEVIFPTPVIEEKVKEVVLPVRVEGTVSRKLHEYVEEYDVPIPVSFEPCDRCSLAGSSYFEGTLQVRNGHDAVTEYIEKAVQKNPEVYITGAKDVKGGVDYQFSDQKYLQLFVHDLKKRFGGEVKIVSKLHTYDHNKSKPVYRLTALIRLPSFRKGDVIETEKKLIQVTRMGSTINGFDLRRRKNTALSCPADEEVVIHEPVRTTVSAVKPRLAILDPEDYQEVPVMVSVDDVNPGDVVRAVMDSREKWYLLK